MSSPDGRSFLSVPQKETKNAVRPIALPPAPSPSVAGHHADGRLELLKQFRNGIFFFYS